MNLKQVTILAVIIELIFWLTVLAVAHADTLPDDDALANAIYKAENSRQFPYGVRSIDTHGDQSLARRICLNSIKNAKIRYIKAGSPGDFIAFMGRRYSPPAQNPNWVKNVKYFLQKETK